MDTPQHTWTRKGEAARHGVVRPPLAALLLSLVPWSLGRLHAQEACSSSTFVQPPGSPVGVGYYPESVAVGNFNRDDGTDHLAHFLFK